MLKRYRRNLETIFAVAVALALVLLVGVGAAAKSYDHPLIEQVYTFLPNGDAEVEEIRTFHFDGSFSWAQILRETKGEYGSYRIDYAEVIDADTRQPLQFEQGRSSGQRQLKWFYEATNTTKRFLIRYRIGNAIQRYGDAAQFYWQAIEGDHAPLQEVEITLIPPGPSPQLFKVFVHGRTKPGELNIADDFTRAVVTQSDIPQTSFVELRVLLDPALFPEAKLRSGESHESLLADERRITESTRRTAQRLVYTIAGVALVFLAVLAVYLWLYFRYGREHRVVMAAEYEHEPPRDLPPAVVTAILTQSAFDKGKMPRAFAATLLEGARLGYLEIHEAQGDGFLGIKALSDDYLAYTITPEGRALLAEKQIDNPGKDRRLENFEIEVLRLVFDQVGDGSQVTSDEIEKWGKKTRGRKTNFFRFVNRWGPQLRSWFETNHFQLDDPTSERARRLFMAAGSVTGFGLLFVGFSGTGIWIGIAGAAVLVLTIPFAHAIARRTREAAEEHHRWSAFKKFISDFSAMKDAGPNLLPLWEKYLVYAAALGVADKLLANLKLYAAEY
ncbi:DUF2207 family protein, partial [Candidatus Zixiibacteriota bacterium]